MNRTRAAGFVITLEFLLVMALFVLPVMLGMILLGRKLYTLYLNQRDFIEQPYSRAVVWDSTPNPPLPATCPPTCGAKVVGPVVGYDQFEAPLVIFRDDTTKGGVVLGVRADRFTSYGAVYYDTVNCTGTTPYLRVWSSSVMVPSGGILYYPPNGAAYRMQGISYAMGNGNVLYASTTAVLAMQPTIQSVWMSQDVAGGPCYSAALGTLPNDLAAASVVIDFDGAAGLGPPYVSPFRLAFPTPGSSTDPALRCPMGECVPP